MNVTAPILRHARTQPDAAALVDDARTITYRELAALVARTGAHLAASGAAPRVRVGVCLKDTADNLIALLALARLGAVSVPLDWRARPAENARLIAAAGIQVVLVEPGSQPVAICPAITVDDTWHCAVAQGAPVGEAAAIAWHDLFVISASSGSTGAPKLTLMTHQQYHFAVAGMLEIMGLTGRHRYLNTLPLYYSGGRNSCIAHLMRGDCVILYSSLFDAREYVDAARRHAATIGVLVPTMLRRLLNDCRGSTPLLPDFAALFSAGAPLYADEKRRALRCLTQHFHERYGTAETLALAVLRPNEIAARADSVGQPHSLVEVEIVDDEDRILPDGAVGHLRVRGPGVASPLPASASEANFRGGWFYPGELARLDERSFLYIEGRSSELIIRGGANVYPAEVEQALLEHEAITDAAAFGRRADDNDEEVVACIVARREIALGELVAHCRSRLSAFKVPRYFHVLEQLPRNTAGKIDKSALTRALAEKR